MNDEKFMGEKPGKKSQDEDEDVEEESCGEGNKSST